MNIFHAILAGAEQFYRKTNLRPTNVYIGRLDLRELQGGRDAKYFDWTRHFIGEKRAEIGGMKIYEVDADNHLNFST